MGASQRRCDTGKCNSRRKLSYRRESLSWKGKSSTKQVTMCFIIYQTARRRCVSFSITNIILETSTYRDISCRVKKCWLFHMVLQQRHGPKHFRTSYKSSPIIYLSYYFPILLLGTIFCIRSKVSPRLRSFGFRSPRISSLAKSKF